MQIYFLSTSRIYRAAFHVTFHYMLWLKLLPSCYFSFAQFPLAHPRLPHDTLHLEASGRFQGPIWADHGVRKRSRSTYALNLQLWFMF